MNLSDGAVSESAAGRASRGRRASPRRDERGNASLALLAAAAVVMVLALGIADLGIFLLARARAQTAADAAALAAASELVPGVGHDPRGQAARFAGANGARLLACECRLGARSATVLVAVPVRFLVVRVLGAEEVTGGARAEVDLSILGRG